MTRSNELKGTMLTGYIEAMMVYCAITGESAVGMPYDFCFDKSLRSEFDMVKFVNSNSKDSYTTNFDAVFNSEAHMKGLQKPVDWHLVNKPYRTN